MDTLEVKVHYERQEWPNVVNGVASSPGKWATSRIANTCELGQREISTVYISNPVSKRPTFSPQKKREGFWSWLFSLPVSLVVRDSRSSTISPRCLPLMLKCLEWDLGAVCLERAFSALTRSWSILHAHAWLICSS